MIICLLIYRESRLAFFFLLVLLSWLRFRCCYADAAASFAMADAR